MIKVHIVDDHPVLVEGLINLLNKSGITTITGVSHTLSDCRNTIAFNLPDILLLDLNLSDGSGIDFCEEIHGKYPDIKVLILSMHHEYSIVKRTLQAGASGYIVKDSSITVIIDGMKAIMAGDIFLCEEIDRLMNRRIDESIRVTRNELEVLQLLAKGLDSRAIAKITNRSHYTIDSTRKRLLLKFDAKNVAELIKKATDGKWI
ncbi:MAG: response regulator transcription factor [Prevotellaceae bacterium]|jgi:DNA-binding NarL/FixJ family response regulator|nr:response regulator transcription factor [Prevotellaceae bacterium]